MLKFRLLSPNDADLDTFVDTLASEDWHKKKYSKDEPILKLKQFLENNNHVYVVGHVADKLVGRAFGYIHTHPNGSKALYVDEVDTQVAYRRQGVATGMMQELLLTAKKLGAKEVWLNTETNNIPALATYRKLKPSEEEKVVNFCYKIK